MLFISDHSTTGFLWFLPYKSVFFDHPNKLFESDKQLNSNRFLSILKYKTMMDAKIMLIQPNLT